MDEPLALTLAATGVGAPDVPVSVTGEGSFLPSRLDVDGLAVAAVAAAGAGAADMLAARLRSDPPWVSVDARGAAAAFVGEQLFEPQGWELPPVWDSIAGDYRAVDAWVRLHTNYASHRRAALSVLGCAEDREAVSRAVAGWQADELEAAVIAAGGAAARLRSSEEWGRHPAGIAAAGQPLVAVASRSADIDPIGAAERPFDGLRVLDLTRVIAGPVCTRFLAAYGAEVLRIDPPGFEEVPALVPDVTAGKRSAALDLRDPDDRNRFAGLVERADVLVCGLRADALDGLGFAHEELLAINPRLVTARLDAYGWQGPWALRRGFDSLVQMSTGIAFASDDAPPQPLPAQALDHATGFIMAGAVGRALAVRERAGLVRDIRCSLVATAELLLGSAGDPEAPAAGWTGADTEAAETALGPVRRVPVPTVIDGVAPELRVEAGPLGRHEAAWHDRT